MEPTPEASSIPYHLKKLSIKTPVLFATDNGLYLRKYVPLNNAPSANLEDPRNFRYEFQRCDVENDQMSETMTANQSTRQIPKYDFASSQSNLISDDARNKVYLVPSKVELENSRKLKYQQIKMDTLKDFFPRIQ